MAHTWCSFKSCSFLLQLDYQDWGRLSWQIPALLGEGSCLTWSGVACRLKCWHASASFSAPGMLQQSAGDAYTATAAMSGCLSTAAGAAEPCMPGLLLQNPPGLSVSHLTAVLCLFKASKGWLYGNQLLPGGQDDPHNISDMLG